MRDGENLRDFQRRARAQDEGGGADVQVAQLPQIRLLPLHVRDSVRRTHDIDHAGDGTRVHAAVGSERQAAFYALAGHREWDSNLMIEKTVALKHDGQAIVPSLLVEFAEPTYTCIDWFIRRFSGREVLCRRSP